MSISLIGIDGTTVASNANPIPVTLPVDSNTRPQHVTFTHKDAVLDSFNRLRVSEPRVAFAYTFANGIRREYWDDAAFGAGTALPAAVAVGGAPVTPNTDFCLNLNTTTAANTGYWIQSLYHIRYIPGISTLTRITFQLNILQANQVVRVGAFTDQGTFPSNQGDGVFLELDGLTPYICVRTLTGGGVGAVTRIAQVDWNEDKFNGTGPSGITIDFTKTQHLAIEWQWLGVGTVKVGFETPNGIVWAHSYSSPNVLSLPYTRTGTLPVRAEIRTTGVVGVAGILKLVNTTVIQEGDVVQRGSWRYRSGNSGTTVKAMNATAAAGALHPLMAIRQATTSDITKRALVVPTRVNVLCQAAATGPTALEWALVYAPTTLTGATFAAQTTEAVQVDSAATSTTAIAGGIVVARGVFANVANATVDRDLIADRDNLIKMTQNAAGSLTTTGASIYVLCVAGLGAAATAGGGFCASMEWKEDI